MGTLVERLRAFPENVLEGASLHEEAADYIERLEAASAAARVCIEANQQERASAITCLREIAAMGKKAGSERATQWLLQHGYPLEEGGYLPGKGFVDSHPPVMVRGEPMACPCGKCHPDGYFGER
jgi:hypothetical protein